MESICKQFYANKNMTYDGQVPDNQMWLIIKDTLSEKRSQSQIVQFQCLQSFCQLANRYVQVQRDCFDSTDFIVHLSYCILMFRNVSDDICALYLQLVSG